MNDRRGVRIPRRARRLVVRACGWLLLVILALALGGGWFVVGRTSTTLRQASRAQDVRDRVTATAVRRTDIPVAGPSGTPAPAATPLPTATLRTMPALARQPFTVLVLGIDQRPRAPTTSVRADTLPLVRGDPQAPRVALLSIPRDTFVRIPGVSCGGMHKINEAYACGFHHPKAYGSDVAPTDASAALCRAETGSLPTLPDVAASVLLRHAWLRLRVRSMRAIALV